MADINNLMETMLRQIDVTLSSPTISGESFELSPRGKETLRLYREYRDCESYMKSLNKDFFNRSLSACSLKEQEVILSLIERENRLIKLGMI